MQITDRSSSTRSASCPKPTSSSHQHCKARMRICSPPNGCRSPPSFRKGNLADSATAKTAPGVSVQSSGTQVMSGLSGKTALVTGASLGIGRASALALAAAGAQVLVHYGRAANEADRVVGEIREAGGRGDAVAADLERADG